MIIAFLSGLFGTMAATSIIGRARPGTAMGSPRFVDETAASGVEHTYGGDSDYQVGGGVAVFDCNADGKPDLYLAGGASPAALYRNESPIGGRSGSP